MPFRSRQLSPIVRIGASLLVPIGLLQLQCSDGSTTRQPVELVLTSPSFRHGDAVPETYTCTGSGIAPRLEWSGVPEAARSLALSLEKVGMNESLPDRLASTGGPADVDPPPLLWLLYNLPPHLTSLPENYSMRHVDKERADEFVHGANMFGTRGYDGPCPPTGNPASYIFRIYALSDVLRPDRGASAHDVRSAMSSLVIGQGELAGTYGYPIQEAK